MSLVSTLPGLQQRVLGADDGGAPTISPLVISPARARRPWPALSRHLGLPLFSKDVIKETHADVLGAEPAGWPQRRWNAALGATAWRDDVVPAG